MWVICFNPSDYPGKYTVRVHCMVDGETRIDPSVQVAKTIEAARNLIPGGLVCMPRDPSDAPVIVETWL